LDQKLSNSIQALYQNVDQFRAQLIDASLDKLTKPLPSQRYQPLEHPFFKEVADWRPVDFSVYEGANRRI